MYCCILDLKIKQKKSNLGKDQEIRMKYGQCINIGSLIVTNTLCLYKLLIVGETVCRVHGNSLYFFLLRVGKVLLAGHKS